MPDRVKSEWIAKRADVSVQRPASLLIHSSVSDHISIGRLPTQ
jgi:hypothetical protein